jgi:hypothetical protein
VIALPDGSFVALDKCVFQAPVGYRPKVPLHSIYDGDLKILFQTILNIRSVNFPEAAEYLEQLRSDTTSTLSDVLETYRYLQRYPSNQLVLALV